MIPCGTLGRVMTPRTGVTPEGGVTWRVALHMLLHSMHDAWRPVGTWQGAIPGACGERDLSPCTYYASRSESPGPIKFAANMMPVEAGVRPRIELHTTCKADKQGQPQCGQRAQGAV